MNMCMYVCISLCIYIYVYACVYNVCLWSFVGLCIWKAPPVYFHICVYIFLFKSASTLVSRLSNKFSALWGINLFEDSHEYNLTMSVTVSIYYLYIYTTGKKFGDAMTFFKKKHLIMGLLELLSCYMLCHINR